MGTLLNDDSVIKYSYRKDFFGKVHEVMKRYLGNVSHEVRVKFARIIYSMSLIAEVQKKDIVTDFVKYLETLKKKYKLALITTAPEDSVEPMLEKIELNKLFDIVYKSPIDRHPDKKQLFKEFIKKHSKPIFYIGNGDKDIESCKKVGIKTISVNWVSKGKYKGHFDVKSVRELKKVLK